MSTQTSPAPPPFPAAVPPRLLDRLAGGHTTPARLRLLLAGTVAFSLLWGAAAAWTAAQRASGAGDVVTASEPLSFDAQQIYQSLSDADSTEAVAFLAGTEPPGARNRYLADTARAESYLEAATAEAGSQAPRAQLTVLSTGIPVYTGLVETARSDNLQGLPVGAAFLGEASNLMRTRLLPAADGLYAHENARLAAADGQATALPILAIIVAILVGFVLLRAQRWLTRRTHRTFNSGLVVASVAGLLSLIWLVTGLTIARVQLLDARDHGSAPVEALAQADIAALGANADESLTLINRVGDDTNQTDFVKAERRIGPGSGTLLTKAAVAASGSPGAGPAAAAAATAPAWFATHRQVRALDDGGNYNAAVQLAIGSGPTSSGAMFRRMETDLTTAIAADQAVFGSAAPRAESALTGMEAGMIAAALVMAAGSAWGFAPRLAEYR
jgi:hypothetical protein